MGVQGTPPTNVTTAPREVFKTGTSLASGDGLVAEGTVEGNRCRIIVDTGSNISIVRTDVLRQGGSRVNLQPVSSHLRTVTGATTPIQGKGHLRLRVGTFEGTVDMWVADITDDCILGLDFLEQNGCQVDLMKGTLHIGDEEVPLHKTGGSVEPACCRVLVKTCITLPPNAASIIPVRVDVPTAAGKWAVMEPRDQPGPVGLMDCPVRIKRGTEIASCSLVQCVRSSSPTPRPGAGKVELPDLEMPPHLRPLYERSVAELTDTQQQPVAELLCANADLFSKGADDLGRTDVTWHPTDTGDATAVRQRPYRLPLMKRSEAHQVVDQMVERDQIEPWQGPYLAEANK